MGTFRQEFRDFIGAVISFPQDFLGVFGMPPAESGAMVNEFSAIQIAAYFACVRTISDAVGTLPLNVYERLPDGGERIAYDHPLFDLLHVSPNPEVAAADLRQAGQSHVLMAGNCYIEIDWANSGYPRALYLRSPFSTFPYRRQATGELIYKTHDNPSGAERTVEAEDMIHVKGLGIDSLVGLSPVKYYAREVLGSDIAAQSYGSKFFANQANPSGYLEAPGNLTPQQKLDSMRTWQDAHGRGNAHKIAVLEGGWKWQQTSIAPDEAQFIQTRELNRAQIGAIFGVPEHMIGGKEESRTSLEQKSLEFLTFTLKPWLKKWEQAINMKLFPKLGRTAGKYFCKFDVSSLEQADFKTMIQGLQMARYAGLMTTNEGRKKLSLNPYDAALLDSDNPADKLIIPVNMQVVTNEPPVQQPGGGGGMPENPLGGEPTGGLPETKAIQRCFTSNWAVFRDAFGRILARKKPNQDDFQRTFLPVMVSIASAFNFDPVAEPGDMVLSASKTQFLRDYIGAMTIRAKDWTADTADEQAANELTRAIRFLREKIEAFPREEETELQES